MHVPESWFTNHTGTYHITAENELFTVLSLPIFFRLNHVIKGNMRLRVFGVDPLPLKLSPAPPPSCIRLKLDFLLSFRRFGIARQ